MGGVRGWFQTYQPTVLFTERRVTNGRMRLSGRIDLGILYRGEPVVVDYKTGGASAAHGVQACGYLDLANADPVLRAMANGKPWRRAILRLPGNGQYRWVGEAELDPRDTFLWRSALALTAWRYDHGRLAETDEAYLQSEAALVTRV